MDAATRTKRGPVFAQRRGACVGMLAAGAWRLAVVGGAAFAAQLLLPWMALMPRERTARLATGLADAMRGRAAID